MTLAPIALFVYNRPSHTQQTLEALKKNHLAVQSELFVFSDGPKNENDRPYVAQVRGQIKQLNGFKQVTMQEQTRNQGLANSIVTGVTTILNQFETIIVLEDDIVTSPFFLDYMNDALQLYAQTPEVMHVSGHMFPTPFPLPETFFYNDTLCWGWGTWQRAWQNFNPDAQNLLKKIRSHHPQRFDRHRGYLQQLEANVSGKMKTWAVKWGASVYLKQGFCLQPKYSLTRNIGADGSGINRERNSSLLTQAVYNHQIKVSTQPLRESRLVYLALYWFMLPNMLKRFHYVMLAYLADRLKQSFLYPWFMGFLAFQKRWIQTQKERQFLKKYGESYRTLTPCLPISGWLSEDQMVTLYDLAKSLNTKTPIAVEIGSWQGRSTTAIAKGLIETSEQPRLICIDPFDPQSDPSAQAVYQAKADFLKTQSSNLKNKFVENVSHLGVFEMITILEGYSTDFAKDFNQKIDYLFIDGNHAYEHAKSDFLDWSPKLRSGGIIIFHDVDFDPSKKPTGQEVYPGPALVVKEYLINSPKWQNGQYHHGMYWATKV